MLSELKLALSGGYMETWIHRKLSFYLYTAYICISDITAQERVGINVRRCTLRQNWLWRWWTAAGPKTTAANARMLRTNTSTTCVTNVKCIADASATTISLSTKNTQNGVPDHERNRICKKGDTLNIW